MVRPRLDGSKVAEFSRRLGEARRRLLRTVAGTDAELEGLAAPEPELSEESARRAGAQLLVGVPAALLIFAVSAFGQGASLALEGERLFQDQGCYGCHTVGKAGTPIGPDLSTIGSKRSEADLRRWLMDPYQQKPTAHMPALAMRESEARALAAYLASLR